MPPAIKIITKDRLGQQMSNTREACKSTPLFFFGRQFYPYGKI